MNPMQAVERLVARARRRLFAETFIHLMLWCLAAGLLASAAWFVVGQAFQLAGGLESLPHQTALIWGVAGGLMLASVLVAGVLAWIHRPTKTASALSVDEQFALKERVTTALALTKADLETPAGTALLADIDQHIKKLDFTGKFPMRIGWAACVAPVGAFVLAVLAYVSDPSWTFGNDRNAGLKQAALTKDAQSKLENLKPLPLQKRELTKEDLEKLKELEDAWKKLIEKAPPKNEEEIRERVREMRSIEEQLKERMRELQKDADKEGELQAALKKLANLDAKDKKLSEGPIRDLEDALAEGKFDKAEDIIDRLQKKMKNKEINEKEQQELAEQLAGLERKLRQLMEANDLQNMKELQELAKLLGECKDCLARENGEQLSAEKLGELLKNLKNMKKMNLTKEQLKELAKCQGELGEACEAMLLALNRVNGMNSQGLPGGRRPVGEEPKNSKIKDERLPGQLDPNGQMQISGFSRGGTFSKIPAKDVGGAFKQAVQEAPEAIERQQIPPDAADIAKGYFQKLAE